jgi:hypothetical protein
MKTNNQTNKSSCRLLSFLLLLIMGCEGGLVTELGSYTPYGTADNYSNGLKMITGIR